MYIGLDVVGLVNGAALIYLSSFGKTCSASLSLTNKVPNLYKSEGKVYSADFFLTETLPNFKTCPELAVLVLPTDIASAASAALTADVVASPLSSSEFSGTHCPY